MFGVGTWVFGCGCLGVWGVWVFGCLGVGVWVFGCLGVWVCGCLGVGVWVFGCLDVWASGCVGVWVWVFGCLGCLGVWVFGCGCLGVWASGCVGVWVWVFGCLGIGRWVFGLGLGLKSYLKLYGSVHSATLDLNEQIGRKWLNLGSEFWTTVTSCRSHSSDQGLDYNAKRRD